MIPEIARLFDEGHTLAIARERYDLDPTEASLMEGFESFVYKMQRGDAAFILKVTHTIGRSESMLQAEADFLRYLHNKGAFVAPMVLSKNNRFVESFPDTQERGRFLLTCYPFLRGELVVDVPLEAEVIQAWGRSLGMVHRLSSTYEPKSARRQHGLEHELFQFDRYLVPTDPCKEILNKILEEVGQLDRSTGYGLCHGDPHDENVFYSDRKCHLIDFDDCEYHWFIYDIAVILAHTIPPEKKDEPQFNRFLIHHLWRGYQEEHELDKAWLAKLPLFIKLRYALMYSLCHQIIVDPMAPTAEEQKEIERRRGNIVNGFRNLAELLRTDFMSAI